MRMAFQADGSVICAFGKMLLGHLKRIFVDLGFMPANLDIFVWFSVIYET